MTPDYFNSCSLSPAKSVPSNSFGYQHAIDGEAYVGILAFDNFAGQDSREAITVELRTPLTAGSKYVFQAYFSLADTRLYSITSMGYKLSESQLIGVTAIVEYEPTYFNETEELMDKDEWVLLADTVVAFGGERFLTIANFLPDSLSDTTFVGEGVIAGDKAYYYIDDVSLIPLDTLLSVSDYGLSEAMVYPNPASERVTLQSKVAFSNCWLTDVSGRRIKALRKESALEWETGLTDLPTGIYLVEFVTEDGIRGLEKIVKL